MYLKLNLDTTTIETWISTNLIWSVKIGERPTYLPRSTVNYVLLCRIKNKILWIAISFSCDYVLHNLGVKVGILTRVNVYKPLMHVSDTDRVNTIRRLINSKIQILVCSNRRQLSDRLVLLNGKCKMVSARTIKFPNINTPDGKL